MGLQELVEASVARTGLPGAVALVSGPEETEVAVVGVRALDGPPMTRDTLFRIASITKPIVAAAALALVEQDRLGLADPIERWLPELADPMVLRALDGPVDDVVPASRSVTVGDLLTFRGGLGLPERFDLPISSVLFDWLGEGPPRPQEHLPPAEWLARVAEVPLLHQPGEGWTYNLGYELLGLLVERVAGATLGEALTETILEPTGMRDTGFWTETPERLASCYRHRDSGLDLVDPPEGQWARPPVFPSGGGGLVSTVDDWHRFGRMLLADGEHGGRRVLSPQTVRLMTTAHVDGGPEHLFLDGQGWGMGGGVDLRSLHPWNVPGRYGWVGGTGTAAYVVPSSGTVVVWLSQVELGGPDGGAAMADVLTYAVS